MIRKNYAAILLQDAADAIGDRALHRDTAEGDKPMAKAVAMFNALKGLQLTERDGRMFAACVKMARSEQGVLHEDDYIDACGELALAGEAAFRAERCCDNINRGCKGHEEQVQS